MKSSLLFDPALAPEELRGFSRTVAEIEWLLLILVLLYQVAMHPNEEVSGALAMAMFFFAAFVLAFHYVQFYKQETYFKLAIETWVMLVFITWVLMYTGRLESPLINLYLLVVITSALTLGKFATVLQVLLIGACYVWLGYPASADWTTGVFTAGLAAQLAPLLLVAYITTMLSSDIRRALVQIKLLSETDELTGVINMRAFNSIGQRIFRQASRYDRPLSLLMIDSDSLKAVNDTYGHEAGNRMLKMTVQCIESQLRETDIVARYGGDEFIVLLPETPCAGAAGLATRILKKVESTLLPVRDRDLTTTISIGVACYPEHGGTLEMVMERADKAMYASKAAGRNQITVATTGG